MRVGRPDHLANFLGQAFQVDPFAEDGHLLGVNLAQVEDIVDQAQEVGAAAIDLLDIIVQAGRPVGRLGVQFWRVDHQVAEADDKVQGTAQLVADGQNKAVAVGAGFFGVAARPLEHLVQAFELVIGLVLLLEHAADLGAVQAGFVEQAAGFFVVVGRGRDGRDQVAGNGPAIKASENAAQDDADGIAGG